MTKTQVFQLIGILLAIGFVILFLNFRGASPPPLVEKIPMGQPLSAGGPADKQPDQGAATTASNAPLQQEPNVSRDPFEIPVFLKEVLHQKEIAKTTPPKANTPTAVAAQIQPILTLQGILWGTSKPRAIINRRVVSVGDSVEDATVVAVGKNGVTVSFDGQEYLLKLPTKGGGSEDSQASSWPPPQHGGQSF